MKIAVAQLNYHVGNFEDNVEKIKQYIDKGRNEGVDLAIFTELAICGYVAKDLLEREDFIRKCKQATDEVVAYTQDIAIVIGAPTINDNEKGRMLYNSALFVENQEIKFVQHKTLLPSYDIFDEYRYFETNTDFNVFVFKGKKIGLTICEDIWERQYVENKFVKNSFFPIYPVDELMKYSPNIIINISASPFSYLKNERRNKVVCHCAKKYHVPVIYANQVGADTDVLFDGVSKFVNSKGDIVEELALFEEDFRIVDMNAIEKCKVADTCIVEKIPLIYKALKLGIRDYFNKMKFQRAVLGLSGGLDSAVTLALAAEALGSENIKGILMPSKYSSEHSVEDAMQIAKNLKVNYEIIPIKNITDDFDIALHPIFKGLPFNITEENIQARIRGNLLMAVANKLDYILLNTSNKSEMAVGYSTLYGDMSGGLSVLGDVYKTDVYRLAKYINRKEEIIPRNTIVKPPSAELRPDQKDSDSLPEYDILDNILYQYIEEQKSKEAIVQSGVEEKVVEKVIRLVDISEYKRYQSPPILRVSPKAFGKGRQIPLVAWLK